MVTAHENLSAAKALTISARMMGRLGNRLNLIARFLAQYNQGIIMLTGPMRAGKSALLLMMLEVLKGQEPKSVLCVKPLRDNRAKGLKSRTGASAKARTVRDAQHFRNLIKRHKPKIVVFDEVQFTDAEMHQAILDVARNTLVVVATLDLTWAAVEFEAFSTISTQGEERLGSSFLIVKLTGFCQLCTSERATHSKRLEAPPDGGDIFVGDAQYLTVCARCHSA